ncbi:MAG: GNAT family N-acetyltransferase [Ktedonobacterales bacterium]
MNPKDEWLPVVYHTLSPERVREVAELRDRCNAADGLYLKIGVAMFEMPALEDAERPRAFLVFAGNSLAGYCSLEGNQDSVEICGMVAPEKRRRGIGTALLAAAQACCTSHSVQETLLICEEASAAGKAFAAARCGPWQFAEHRMQLQDFDAMRQGLTRESGLVLRRARADEAGQLAHMSAVVFDSESELATIQADIKQELQSSQARFYLAELGSIGPVSSLKLYLTENQASIYAFGVLPQYRRRGLAWQTLALLTQQLQADGISQIGLEVEATNLPAIALYQACGFSPVTTYGYYRAIP